MKTPTDTPFYDGFTPSTTKGNTSADLTSGVHTQNIFTPLYTESQETDHTNVNTNQQSPAPMRTSLEAIRDANLAVAAAAAETEAHTSAVAAAAEMEAPKEWKQRPQPRLQQNS